MQGAETIQITFDPGKTTYDKLLNLFWPAHNPTEIDSQEPDTGKQYRSAIFYVDEQQRAGAEKSKAQAQKKRTQSRSQLKLPGQDHFGRPPRIIRTFAGKIETIRTSDK